MTRLYLSVVVSQKGVLRAPSVSLENAGDVSEKVVILLHCLGQRETASLSGSGISNVGKNLWLVRIIRQIRRQQKQYAELQQLSEALVVASGLPLAEVLAALTELELDGRVACENGRWVGRAL